MAEIPISSGRTLCWRSCGRLPQTDVCDLPEFYGERHPWNLGRRKLQTVSNCQRYVAWCSSILLHHEFRHLDNLRYLSENAGRSRRLLCRGYSILLEYPCGRRRLCGAAIRWICTGGAPFGAYGTLGGDLALKTAPSLVML